MIYGAFAPKQYRKKVHILEVFRCSAVTALQILNHGFVPVEYTHIILIGAHLYEIFTK